MEYPCLSTNFTSCLLYTGQTLSSDECDLVICQGTYFNTILADIYESICTIGDTCKIKVSSTDDCCNYLQAKLTSEDDSVTFTKNSTTVTNDDGTTSNCETLDLSVSDSVILSSDWVDFSDTDDDLMSFTLPVNSLKADGDQIIIEEFFVKGTGIDSDLTFLFGATTLGTFKLSDSTSRKLKVVFTVTRVDNTTIRWESSLSALDSNFIVQAQIEVVSSPTAVAALDINTNDIKTTVSGLLTTQKYLTVKLIKI